MGFKEGEAAIPKLNQATRDHIGMLAYCKIRTYPAIAKEFSVKRYDVSNWRNTARKRLEKVSETRRLEIIAKFKAEHAPKYGEIVLGGSEEKSLVENAVIEAKNTVISEVISETGTRTGSVKTLRTLVQNGVNSITQEIEAIHSSLSAKFIPETETLDEIHDRINNTLPIVVKPADILSLVRAMSELMKLRRAQVMVPFGAVDPSKVLTASDNPSQHLHLHNHGGDFKPK